MRLASLVIVVTAACSHDARGTSTMNGPPATKAGPGSSTGQPGMPLITSYAEAKDAVGQRVRVLGIAEREKLGDAVTSKGFSVTCLSPRFSKEQLDQLIEVEGVLELTDEFQATVGPNGQITQ